MNKEHRSNVIGKIKKLLSLGTSHHQHEAESALAKAQSLLLLHNIDEAEIHSAELDDRGEYIMPYIEFGRLPIVFRHIHCVIDKYFFVELLVMRYKETSHNKRGVRIVLFGRKSNVEIAKHTFTFLQEVYHNLWDKYAKENNTDIKFRHCFWRGVTEGLMNKLKKEREKTIEQSHVESTALVKIDAALQKAFKKEFPEVETEAQKNDYQMDAGLFLAGMVDGGNIELLKILKESKQEKRTVLN